MLSAVQNRDENPGTGTLARFLARQVQASIVWLVQAIIEFLLNRLHHRKVWQKRIWPTLLQSR